MAISRRRNVIASRRKRDDEGEEEGSLAGGDIEDDSLSEGFVSSIGEDDADVEGSEISADNDANVVSETATKSAQHINGHTLEKIRGKDVSNPSTIHFVTSKDTEAMMNGLQISEDSVKHEEIHFEDTKNDISDSNVSRDRTTTQNTFTTNSEAKTFKDQNQNAPTQPSVAHQNNGRQTYIKELAENPTFVPNRGGFFLHDNRVSGPGANNSRGYPRGRGRAFGPYSGPNVG